MIWLPGIRPVLTGEAYSAPSDPLAEISNSFSK